MAFLTQRGFSFGLSSGIITTLGLMVGLFSGTQSKLAVLGGILTIAVADAFSDSLSMHISEEAQNKLTDKQIWKSTLFTFLAKLFFALIFVVPIIVFALGTAVIINIFLGIIILVIYNYIVARRENKKPIKIISEHLFITIIVIILTYFIGDVINKYFV